MSLGKGNHIEGKTMWSIIMDHFADGRTFCATDARMWLRRHNMTDKTAITALSNLVTDRHLRDLGNEVFQFRRPIPDGYSGHSRNRIPGCAY